MVTEQMLLIVMGVLGVSISVAVKDRKSVV